MCLNNIKTAEIKASLEVVRGDEMREQRSTTHFAVYHYKPHQIVYHSK